MRKTKPNRTLNWVSIGFRLSFLIAAGLYLNLTAGFTVPVVIVFGVELLAVIFSITFVGFKYRNRSEHIISVLVDVIFAHLLYQLALPAEVNMGWVGILPVVTAALFFQWPGMIIVAVTNLIVQGVLSTLNGSLDIVLLLILSVVFLVFGAVTVMAVPSLSKESQPAPKSRQAVQKAGADLERQSNIFQMISALSSTLNYQRVLEMALDLSSNTLIQMNAPAVRMRNAALLFVAVDRETTELQISIQRGFLPQDLRTNLPGTSGLLGKTIETGLSQLSTDISTDPELSRFVGLHECRSAYCIPLRAGLDTYGILFFSHPDAGFFSEDRVEILDIVGNQAMIALQNARLYQDLAQEKNRMAEIEEESRKKLARDLHDGPTQSIAAIAMRVNFARRLMERDAKAAAEELFKIEELARRTTKEIRHMLFTLRPLVLESQGLIAALESMAEKMQETYNQQVIVQADQRVVDELEMGKQAVVFYIAEEAVNNARKHAQAGHIWVRLRLLREGLSLLEIEDDGVGFNVNQVDASYENRGSLGMVNMRERTELVSGVLRIDSAPGRGTRVQVVIPLTEEAQDRLRHGM